MSHESKPSPEDGKEIPPQNVGNTVRASWPFSLHDIRDHIAHCSPEGRQALVDLFLWCIDSAHPVPRSEAAAGLGYSDNVLYKLYTGRYEHPDSGKKLDVPEKLISSINKFLELQKRSYIGERSDFVLTPTAKKIWQAAEIARESHSPVFVIGRSHIGKTLALQQYSARNNHGKSPYVRMKAASGLGGMVRRICSRVGVSENSNTASLIDALKGAIRSDMVLILDEIHLLHYTYRLSSFFACMEVIREIYDETNCGMVLCGTKLLLQKMNQGERGEMEQLMRRGVHRFILPEMPTQKDVAMILKHNGFEFPSKSLVVETDTGKFKPFDLLRELAKTSALKAICERMRYAKKLAEMDKGKLSWRYFVEAHLTIHDESVEENDWE